MIKKDINKNNKIKEYINKIYIEICKYIEYTTGEKFNRENYKKIYNNPELGYNELLDLLKIANIKRK